MPPAGCTWRTHEPHLLALRRNRLRRVPADKLWPERIAACSHAERGQAVSWPTANWVSRRRSRDPQGRNKRDVVSPELPLSSQLRIKYSKSLSKQLVHLIGREVRKFCEFRFTLVVDLLSWRHPRSGATSTPPKRSLNAPLQVGRPCSLQFQADEPSSPIRGATLHGRSRAVLQWSTTRDVTTTDVWRAENQSGGARTVDRRTTRTPTITRKFLCNFGLSRRNNFRRSMVSCRALQED